MSLLTVIGNLNMGDWYLDLFDNVKEYLKNVFSEVKCADKHSFVEGFYHATSVMMPTKIDKLDTIENKIIKMLENNTGYAYSSREISKEIDIAHSTARKHLKRLYDDGIIKRGKQKNYNKTYFYYME